MSCPAHCLVDGPKAASEKSAQVGAPPVRKVKGTNGGPPDEATSALVIPSRDDVRSAPNAVQRTATSHERDCSGDHRAARTAHVSRLASGPEHARCGALMIGQLIYDEVEAARR